MITSEMLTYMNDILYIGLRGSRSIGLDVETSDYDILVIVKDSFPHTDVLAGRNDVIWLREKAFVKNFNKATIQITEAILNPIYCSPQFNLHEYQQQVDTIEYREKLLVRLFIDCRRNINAVENTYSKCFRHASLFRWLLSQQLNALDYYLGTRPFPEHVKSNQLLLRHLDGRPISDVDYHEIYDWTENQDVRDFYHSLKVKHNV